MNFWKKLFGGEPLENKPSSEPETSGTREYTEQDNIGTRFDTENKCEGYFIAQSQHGPEPIVYYWFDDKETAVRAFSEVSCMAIATDSGKLICTETLNFGLFKPSSDVWGAFLAGKSLSYNLWKEARECFEKHGGKLRREEEPPKETVQTSKKAGDPKLVSFSHERRDPSSGVEAIYRHHNAPDKASALAWLKENPVDKRFFFLVVDTPEGTIARDIQGIFEA